LMIPDARLKEALSEELAVYERLLGLSKRKQKLLLERFSTDLMKIVAEEEKEVSHLLELENIRIECLTEITGKSNVNLEEALGKISDSDMKSDLWMLGCRLKEIIAEIKTINERNQKLLEQALELTQYSIRLITTLPAKTTYGPGGQGKGSSPGSIIIDRKA